MRQVVPRGRINLSPNTSDKTQEVHFPTHLTEIKSFIGLFNIFRRIVSSIACRAAPLNQKLEKDKLFQLWTTEQHKTAGSWEGTELISITSGISTLKT